MRNPENNPRSRRQGGYSLLMLVFLVASMLILAATATPNLLTQGRRERENETIWRGEQYQRAIGLYFRKFGRYPTKIDDLTKQTNGVRFLRQAYKDPTNKEDGTWRFIYVGPNGQLIGSLRNVSLLQGALSVAGASAGSIFGGGGVPAPPQSPTAGAGAQQQATGAATPDLSASQPQPLTGTVIGGNIIGVGSKTKQSSLRVYKNGDTYQEWEFIWNLLQQTIPGQQQAPLNPEQRPPFGQTGPPQQSAPSQNLLTQ